LNLAAKKSFKLLREAHIADYQKYFQRVSLQLEPLDVAAAEKPTPERLKIAKSSRLSNLEEPAHDALLRGWQTQGPLLLIH